MAWVRCCGGAKKKQPFSIVSSGQLQNGCTQTGGGQYATYIGVFYNQLCTITLPEVMSGYSKLVVVSEGYSTYTSLRTTIAGHIGTAPKTAGVHTVEIALNDTDAYSTIANAINGGTDTCKIFDMYLVP